MKNGKIIIEPIAYKDMRYPTVDDFERDKNGDLVIKVVDFTDSRYFKLIASHAFVEAVLCEHDGIPTSAIDAFDFAFEKNRKDGDESEPGDDSNAPYRRQHCAAMGFERMLAALLGVDWKKYEATLAAVGDDEKQISPHMNFVPVHSSCAETGGKVDLK
jgi:hypothetical protein